MSCMGSGVSTLLIATRNPGKLPEIRSILSGFPILLRSLAEFPETPDVEETGSTFAENAELKARTYAIATSCCTIGDDSGLEVEALGGAPGVYSARYAGPGASDSDRVELLLQELARTGDSERRARFVCVVALADPDGRVAGSFTGTCEGRISYTPRGYNGFGYDPVFVPDGYDQTFGELESDVKDQISHRARALKALQSYLFDSR
jgi:XTP/dITP diphosphohydrolase